MKKALTIVLVTVLIVGWFTLDADNDYKWGPKIIEKYEAEGWSVASTTDNYVDPVAFWTIFSQPISRVGFIKTDEIIKVSNFFVTTTLWADYDFDKTEIFSSNNIYDCQDRKSAYLEDNTNLEKIDFENLEWNVYEEDQPGSEIIETVCERAN